MVQPIETRYAGCLFRSRLEARWAVFYDCLGIDWRYEPEGFDCLDLGWYLPDFWLPAFQFVIEIKPGYPSEEEEGIQIQKLRIATEGLRAKCGFLFYGDIPRSNPAEDYCESALLVCPDPTGGFDGHWQDNAHWWCECPCCGQLGIAFNGRTEQFKCCEGNKWEVSPGQFRHHGINPDSPRLLRAYEAARSERFQ
jgi:hypothetical protein